jgi:hypothetical protein
MYENMVKSKQTQLSAVMSNGSMMKEYFKTFKGKIHVLRYYTKMEKINRIDRRVHYFIIYNGTQPYLSEVLDFVRTTNDKKAKELLNNWENLQ